MAGRRGVEFITIHTCTPPLYIGGRRGVGWVNGVFTINDLQKNKKGDSSHRYFRPVTVSNIYFCAQKHSLPQENQHNINVLHLPGESPPWPPTQIQYVFHILVTPHLKVSFTMKLKLKAQYIENICKQRVKIKWNFVDHNCISSMVT